MPQLISQARAALWRAARCPPGCRFRLALADDAPRHEARRRAARILGVAGGDLVACRGHLAVTYLKNYAQLLYATGWTFFVREPVPGNQYRRDAR